MQYWYFNSEMIDLVAGLGLVKDGSRIGLRRHASQTYTPKQEYVINVQYIVVYNRVVSHILRKLYRTRVARISDFCRHAVSFSLLMFGLFSSTGSQNMGRSIRSNAFLHLFISQRSSFFLLTIPCRGWCWAHR